MSGSTYAQKHNIQSAQYSSAYHWNLKKRVENDRYVRMAKFIYSLAMDGGSQCETGKELGILDIGCGDGRNTHLMWQLSQEDGYTANIVGVDVSSEAIAWAACKTEHINRSQLSFQVGDAEVGVRQFETHPGPVVVILREVIEHLEEQQIDDVLRAITRLKNCILIITVPSVNSPVESKHFRHYDVEMLRKTLQRNHIRIDGIYGFGYRPAFLYKVLSRSKGWLNRVPVLWKLMTPLWRSVSPQNAINLVAVGSADVHGNSVSP